MSTPAVKTIILRAHQGQSLWEATLEQVAQEYRNSSLEGSLWILPDTRHRRAAEMGLLSVLERSALPTRNFCTWLSLACDLLKIPAQSSVVNAATADLVLRETLAESTPEAYQAASDKPNFAAVFWRALQAVEARGIFPGQKLHPNLGPALPKDFTDLHQRFHTHLNRIGCFTPGQILQQAAQKFNDPGFDPALPQTIILGPFNRLNALERELAARLIERVPRVFLAPAPGSVDSFMGGNEEEHSPVTIPNQIHLLRPMDPEAELNVLFATIAREVAEGKYAYGDFRLIHPFAQEEWPRVRDTARRYRVPVRTRLGHPLGEFSGAILLLKVLELFESNWDRPGLLDLLRTKWLDHPGLNFQMEKSAFIRLVLEHPEYRTVRGGPTWIRLAAERGFSLIAQALTDLQRIDEGGRSRRGSLELANWIRKLCEYLRLRLATGPVHAAPEDGISGEEEGWNALSDLIESLVRCLPSEISRSQFFRALRRGLEQRTFIASNRLTDAVEITSGHQDDFLPVKVVLFPNLSSRVPSPERANPFLPEESTADYHDKLHSFHLQLANAQDLAILSCPRFDDEGDELAVSPFLQSLPAVQEEPSILRQAESWEPFQVFKNELARTTESRRRSQVRRATKPESLSLLQRRCRRWSPTRLEQAIQCHYLFFAQNILRLRPQIDALKDPATLRELGSKAHEALRNYVGAKIRGEGYDIVGEARTAFAALAQQYAPHPEVDRAGLEWVNNLFDFAQRGWEQLAAGFAPRKGQDLEIRFGDYLREVEGFSESSLTRLEGQIDRLDCTDDNRALVVEYKYKKAENENKEDFFGELKAGLQPQLPLYWLAVERFFGIKPVAMVQIYLRSGIIRGATLEPVLSWIGDEGKNIEVRSFNSTELQETLKNTLIVLQDNIESIGRGDIQAKPRDYERCGPGRCPYADLCRYRENRWIG